jgi:hypothetical protein
MLFVYRQQVQRLLNDLVVARFNPGDLDFYINTARGQIAGEAECIRVYGNLAVTAPTQQYPFSAITFPAGTVGVRGVINVRMMTFSLLGATGAVLVTPREWEYFNTFFLSQNVPQAGVPSTWSQFGQGVNGTIFINLPDTNYALNLDTVCYPSSLNTDADPEAIPYLWTDAVPYFAAYLALLTAKDGQGADNMMKLYQQFVMRARAFATPSVLSGQYEQAPDPMMSGRLGVQPMRAGNGP